ncbi:hypothetical protein PQO03_11360 [Lentisphaera profundi]|uniref:Tetracyclin repressor-like C-terminal domain-containing protein n=1 Tax=Lentisphaera profundi TaxID=1658616 RepID=A0ABY7VQ47_9BACT|nr:hypothetical protein [Lentisphaera profundi]WDE96306.1 hypothetical protein PQO03_11360 [Lentisphaera profundi]
MKKNKIRKKYYQYVMEHMAPPTKLKTFLDFADLQKEDFYEKYNSLRQVELDIWKKSLKDVLSHLANTEDFLAYNQRNKGLAFMFSWFEFMNSNQDFFRNCKTLRSPHFIYGSNDFKKVLKAFIKKIIKTGVASQEFKERGLDPKYMCEMFMGLFFMNLRKWQTCSKKKSKKQDDFMDALTEKSMIFFFDSLAPNLFDTFIDLMKHQRSRK